MSSAAVRAPKAIKEDRRRALVLAAFGQIAERGFEGLRTREVAAEAGVNIATLHYYFPTKEALIAEASGRAFTQSLALWDKVAARAPDDELSAIAKAYLNGKHRDDPGAGCLLAALGPSTLAVQKPGSAGPAADFIRSTGRNPPPSYLYGGYRWYPSGENIATVGMLMIP